MTKSNAKTVGRRYVGLWRAGEAVACLTPGAARMALWNSGEHDGYSPKPYFAASDSFNRLLEPTAKVVAIDALSPREASSAYARDA